MGPAIGRYAPSRHARTRLSNALSAVAGSEVALLLDVGSGQGDFLVKVVQTGGVRRCIGFEPSEVGVSVSRLKVRNISSGGFVRAAS